MIDRVVAYVDDTAITLSEFRENYLRMKGVGEVTEEEVINSMINRILILKEAKKMRLEAAGEDELIREYIDIKIRSPIIIREEEITRFFNEHLEKFAGKPYLAVREEIEDYLFELGTNKQLKKHLEELRANAEIQLRIKNYELGIKKSTKEFIHNP